jgi:hypothetical protein
MERRRLFTRLRPSGDAGPLADDDPERSPQLLETEAAEPPSVESAQAEREAVRSERKAAKAQRVRTAGANLSLVRRERRALLREREQRIRDLGGLLLEMYRRDQFNEDLIVEHCAQTMGIENRIRELEAILSRSSSRHVAAGPLCACGAPLLFGARFCANCGRPTDLAATGELCARCLQPLPVGASYCASCGATVGGAASEAGTEPENTEDESENARAEDGGG